MTLSDVWFLSRRRRAHRRKWEEIQFIDLFSVPKTKENGGTKWDLNEKLDREVKKLLPAMRGDQASKVVALQQDTKINGDAVGISFINDHHIMTLCL